MWRLPLISMIDSDCDCRYVILEREKYECLCHMQMQTHRCLSFVRREQDDDAVMSIAKEPIVLQRTKQKQKKVEQTRRALIDC
jgi:hypothetical protein